jgi:hypothetical protein
MNRRAALVAGLLLLAMLLARGVSRLFELRYERGDVYPPYSTLRADPLGAKAIFDAFGALPGYETRRNFRPLVRLNPEQPVTLVYVGIDYQARWMDDELREFESLITTGSRAVFAFRREFSTRSTQRLGQARPVAPPTPPPPNSKPKMADDELPGTAFTEVAGRWQFAFDLNQDDKAEIVHGTAEPDETAGDLEAQVPWHTALYFKGLDPKWRVLYRCNGVPVIAERDYGQGSIVIASDSFFLSNEGLREVRAAKLIARLTGPPRPIVFDEEHHGVTENMNIAGLARKYRLEGALLSLLFVVALFIWKNAASILPPRRAAAADDANLADVTGASAGEGFVNLLRRSVSPSRLLVTCVEEWKKARGRRLRAEELAHVESVFRAHQARGAAGRDVPAAYRTIAEGLNRRSPDLKLNPIVKL